MSILNHNIYDNVRTRVIVLHKDCILLLSPESESDGWTPPGGGLEPGESLADCAAREVLEETGIAVHVFRIAFLREWVVPRYYTLPGEEGVGFGLEVFLYASPATTEIEPRLEAPGASMPLWVPLKDVPELPLWPKELKALASALLSGEIPQGVPSFVSQLESPWAKPVAITLA